MVKRLLTPDQFNYAMVCALSQVLGCSLMSIAEIPKSISIISYIHDKDEHSCMSKRKAEADFFKVGIYMVPKLINIR